MLGLHVNPTPAPPTGVRDSWRDVGPGLLSLRLHSLLASSVPGEEKDLGPLRQMQFTSTWRAC